MIQNANSASPKQERTEFQIHDSLLGDAVERNQLTKPPRLMSPLSQEHPVGANSNDQDHREPSQ